MEGDLMEELQEMTEYIIEREYLAEITIEELVIRIIRSHIRREELERG